jgi:hypothetical protein
VSPEPAPAGGAAGTGLPALDRVLGGLRPGDNVVWQVDRIDDYGPFVDPFVARALAEGKRLVYFRFARHAALVPEGTGAEVHRIHASVGFESFTASIHRVVQRAGPGAYYVFDCLSDLAADWYSDLMLGNFFMVTCPYLFELDTVTYFALLRGHHSLDAVDAIRSTTQLLLDVFRGGERLFVHPLKVDQRHSPTMYLPHAWADGAFRPITDSAAVSELLSAPAAGGDADPPRLDVWERKFLQARQVLDRVGPGEPLPQEVEELRRGLLRMMITRDELLTDLAARHLDLRDLLAIRRRMIGTGLVGGKSVGMLLARAILAKSDPRWARRLEPHDSWFIGSDVFYTFLVRNGCWRARREQRDRASFLAGAAEARRRIAEGVFPPFLLQQLVTMLEYFGQSPIIARSSSLLEDSFGNAFTGKYESVFCPNQGSPPERLAAFLSAVRAIYASTMSEEALRYREHRGLLDRDEQMAILVQRVSGAVHGRYFFPQLAGVALSYNPYAWNPAIDPQAGMMRLVFGLGTRAVDRADDDYTRLVALNAPLRRPESGMDEVEEYAQRRVDVLDLAGNRFVSTAFDEVIRESPDLPVELFASARKEAPRRTGADGPTRRILTFDRLLSATPFVSEMRAMLGTLRDAYWYPVDVEFTANFSPDGEFRLNLVQCRPLQVREGGVPVPPPPDLRERDVLLSTRGPVVGQGSNARVDRIVYVDPDAYARLGTQARHEVARVIGRLMRLPDSRGRSVLALGPGRWGTSTVSLGVPVAFAEIQEVATLCEVVRADMQVVPDVSLGSHFFNDLVEANMLYLAVFPGRAGNRLDEELLRAAPNRLAELLPDDAAMADVVRVADFPLPGDGRVAWLNANCVRQEAVCYLVAPERAPPGA